MAKEVNGQNVLLGAGKIYVDRYVSGVKTGELFLGNCTGLEVTPAVERIQMRSSASKARAVIASDVTSQTLTLRITGTEFSLENYALAFGGNVSALSQGSGGPVSNEVITSVTQGRYYQVGGASPKRNITSVTVTGPSGTPTHVLNTDYEIDAARGRIYIVPGGGIATGSNIEVDYSYTAATNKTVLAGLEASILAFVRYVADNNRGKNVELEIWRTNLASNSAVALIGTEYANFTLEGEIEADNSGHPTEPYFRLTEL